MFVSLGVVPGFLRVSACCSAVFCFLFCVGVFCWHDLSCQRNVAQTIRRSRPVIARLCCLLNFNERWSSVRDEGITSLAWSLAAW